MTSHRLLVTGAAGFIGSNFVHYWLERHPGDRLVALDALTYAGNRESLEPAAGRSELSFVHGDIRDRELVERLLIDEKLDTVVHFAAESHVDRSIAAPDLFLDVNVTGTHSLLKAARAAWLGRAGAPKAHRFHQVSTDEVYGDLGPDDPPFSESTPYAPHSPYAASKAAADHLVRAYHHTWGLDTTISNCSNNYGPYHYPEKLIPLCIVNLLGGKPLPIYGDGSNVRDWLWVGDHCRGIELALDRGRPGRTYNLGGNCERTNLELVRELCRSFDALFAAREDYRTSYPEALAADGLSSLEAVTMVTDRPGHDRRYAIDATRAETELGYRVGTDLADGLQRTIAWYLDHPDWWKSVMDRSYEDWIETQYGASQGDT